MIQTFSKRIVLVGATGYAGRKLASYLLKLTDATVVLAGRSEAKLDRLRTSSQLHEYAHRIELVELDAASFDPAALGDFHLLVNATPEGPHNAQLIEACIGAGADWIDMQMFNELLNPLPALREKIERAGRRFVIQAGFHPGMVAPLVRYAARQMDVMDSAIVSSVIRDRTGLPYTSAAAELISAFRDYKSEMYIDGKWKKLKTTELPKIDFEFGFGALMAYPLEMPELRRFTELMPSLERTGFFVAGFNWFADYVVTPLIMLSTHIAPRQTELPLGRLLSWSTRSFSRPPYGTVVQIDAEGKREGQPASFRLALFHEDAYAMTAVPTVAMIKQMLDGRIQPGIQMMGLCCDPAQLLEDIERTDVAVTR